MLRKTGSSLITMLGVLVVIVICYLVVAAVSGFGTSPPSSGGNFGASDAADEALAAGDPSGYIPACPPLMFFGIRGSGETADKYGGYGQTVQSMLNYLYGLAPGMQSEPINYKAIPVNAFDPRYGANYKKSVQGGTANFMSEYDKFNAKCPGTPVVIAGYSQGVDVAYQVSSLLPNSVRSHVIIVGFGDPHFNPGQSWADAGNYYHNLYGFLVTWFDQEPHYWDSSYRPHLRSWCQRGDDICNATGLRIATCLLSCTHETGYINSGDTIDAANWAYDQWEKMV